ncbi:energy transducer TonB [Comamonas sp. Y33R10-2]|uniref:energy transducer TonB n=1 Tax=Comamonas sp. Y33R10-2 TaxID=2853257 RepID=UPI002103A0A0|nr:energy transducer TonB [Comamonas sp. Y33R10-2]
MTIATFSRPAALRALTITSALAALMLGACTTTAPGKPSHTQSVETTVSQPSWPQWTGTECAPLSQLDQQPQLRRHTRPAIQSKWFPDGLTTKVTFLLEVTHEGKLGRVTWQPADTDPRIVNAIQKSLARWKFKPGMRDGQPVTSCFEQPYELIFPPINTPQAVMP